MNSLKTSSSSLCSSTLSRISVLFSPTEFCHIKMPAWFFPRNKEGVRSRGLPCLMLSKTVVVIMEIYIYFTMYTKLILCFQVCVCLSSRFNYKTAENVLLHLVLVSTFRLKEHIQCLLCPMRLLYKKKNKI